MNKFLTAVSLAAALYLMPNACRNVKEPSAQRSHIEDVTDSNFQREVLQNNRPILVNFHTQWCGVCEQAKPYLESLASEYANRLDFVSYDADLGITDENYNIQGYPTYIIFINGKEAGRELGFDNQAKLEDFINKTLHN